MLQYKTIKLFFLLLLSQQCYGNFANVGYFGSAFYITKYITSLYEKIFYNVRLVDDQELLATYDTIRMGLGLDNVPLYIAFQDFNSTASAVYTNIPSKKIVLLPAFFMASRPERIQILIHELRHHMQYTHNIDVTKDVEDFCVKYGFEYELQRRNSLLGRLNVVGSECQETDADSFAYNQFNCPDCLKIMRGPNNIRLKKLGYIKGSDIDPFIKRAQKNLEYCNAHNTGKEKNAADYMLSDFIPLQLVRKVKQYQQDKEFVNKRLLTIEHIVQRGWGD